MSLEQRLEENTRAILALAQAIAAGFGSGPVAVPAVPTPETAAPVPRKPAPPVRQTKVDPPAETKSEPTPAAEIDYTATLAPALLQLVNKDRAAAIALLAKFGAKHGGDLKPEQYPLVLAAVATALAS